MVNYVAPMVMRIVGVNLIRRTTQEDALSFLYQRDPTLTAKSE